MSNLNNTEIKASLSQHTVMVVDSADLESRGGYGLPLLTIDLIGPTGEIARVWIDVALDARGKPVVRSTSNGAATKLHKPKYNRL